MFTRSKDTSSQSWTQNAQPPGEFCSVRFSTRTFEHPAKNTTRGGVGRSSCL